MLATRNASEDALRLLEAVWWKESETALPVDPVRIARRLGVDVVEADLGQNVSGAIVKDPDQDPTILLNRIDSPNRKRFTCAHELGHYFLRSDDPEEYQYTDLRGTLAGKGTDPEEIYANTFAACLLMPERYVRAFRRRGLTDWEMALKFDVSQEAMHYRLTNLGLR